MSLPPSAQAALVDQLTQLAKGEQHRIKWRRDWVRKWHAFRSVTFATSVRRGKVQKITRWKVLCGTALDCKVELDEGEPMVLKMCPTCREILTREIVESES